MVAEGEQLCYAARNGDVEKVRALIDSGDGRCSLGVAWGWCAMERTFSVKSLGW
ncbi:hypothetical protein SLEP1_g16644 [Rubroshorea leprosula]|uniref:Ankyrin repeat protein n=1 Tax=Rubroshorea leprosula TaxID=152421 RepID=A0AAV5IX50_9ROSI|nr:hypothetical protein SLEP1_g16644 [Rubroshorea leprosula]